jgi:hypothetical protein
MSRKSAYIGGSTVVQLSAGGPERSKRVEEPARVAIPRSGGAKVTLPKKKKNRRNSTNLDKSYSRFKKFRRLTIKVMVRLPYIEDVHPQTARALARIQRRVEEIARVKYLRDVAAEAAVLEKKFNSLMESAEIGKAKIQRAKIAKQERREAKQVAYIEEKRAAYINDGS